MHDEPSPASSGHPASWSLTRLEARLGRDLAGSATVEREDLADGSTAWWVRPGNARSLAVTWIATEHGVTVSTGGLGRGGTWELDAGEDDVAFVEAVVRAVAAGRVTETAAFARSRVELVLDDGEHVDQTGHSGCLSLVPLPGWRRWGTVSRWEPYR